MAGFFATGVAQSEATSRLFEKGLNPVEVATITGHKDTRMLMHYTHLRAKDLVGKIGYEEFLPGMDLRKSNIENNPPTNPHIMSVIVSE